LYFRVLSKYTAIAITPELLFGVARTCTGVGTVDPFVGLQMVMDGAAPVAVHVVVLLTVTVVFALAVPPGPVAVSV
jgi:hypothetical protein